MNPKTATYTAEAQLFTGLYEGLFSYDPINLNPLPAICSSYKISRDKKRWTFTLRSNAKFSDGTEITAESVRKSFLDLLSTKNAPFASLLDCIEGAQEFREGKAAAEDVRIDTRDDHTLVIRLKEPMAHLAKILCHHAFTVVPDNKNVYSGPFILEKKEGQEIQLRKNENYWDKDNVKIPGINILLSDDAGENSYLFNLGQTDWITGNADISKILNKQSVQAGAEFGTMYFFFKLENEPWNHEEFRNALLEAIPYDRLREGCNFKAETFINPLSGYPAVSGISDWDLEDAKILMKEAKEKYGIPQDRKLEIIFGASENSTMKRWLDILTEAWAPLGVELKVEYPKTGNYIAEIPEWKADIFYYTWIGDFADPLAFLELFRGDATLNVSNWKNEEYDAFIAEALRQTNKEDQYRLMAKAEQILLDSGMVIPVLHPVSMNLLDLNSIGGWQINLLDIHPLKYLHIKETPKTRIPNLIKFE